MDSDNIFSLELRQQEEAIKKHNDYQALRIAALREGFPTGQLAELEHKCGKTCTALESRLAEWRRINYQH